MSFHSIHLIFSLSLSLSSEQHCSLFEKYIEQHSSRIETLETSHEISFDQKSCRARTPTHFELGLEDIESFARKDR